jgi:hypothetical protein
LFAEILSKSNATPMQTNNNMKRKLTQITTTSPSKKVKSSTNENKENVDEFSYDAEFTFSSQEERSQSQKSELNSTETPQSRSVHNSLLDDKEVEKLVQEELEKIKNEENINSEENKEMYRRFNELQGVAQEYSLNFKAPEIVVVGMQSDGKSSFVEGKIWLNITI